MNKLIGVVGIVALLVGAYFAREYLNTYTYRFRVTIEVDTDEGTKSGSSVVQVSTIVKPSWMPTGDSGSTSRAIRGEGVFVDLRNGQNLIALLTLGPVAQRADVARFAPFSFF